MPGRLALVYALSSCGFSALASSKWGIWLNELIQAASENPLLRPWALPKRHLLDDVVLGKKVVFHTVLRGQMLAHLKRSIHGPPYEIEEEKEDWNCACNGRDHDIEACLHIYLEDSEIKRPENWRPCWDMIEAASRGLLEAPGEMETVARCKRVRVTERLPLWCPTSLTQRSIWIKNHPGP